MGANTEYIKLETIEKNEWDRIREGGNSSGVIFVPFAVTEGEHGANVTTTANFADVKAEVEAGKNVIAKVTFNGLIVCGGLSVIYPDTEPTVFSFCVVVDNSRWDEVPAPQLFKIALSAEGAAAAITNLTVAT